MVRQLCFNALKTHNQGRSVVAERFIKTLKGQIYKRTAANERKSYLSYLNKFEDQFNNTYHRSTGKKPIDTDYSGLTEEIESNYKAPKFKVGDRVRTTKYQIIFSKGYFQNWSRKVFVIDSVSKTNP